jgi:hypothetical protein
MKENVLIILIVGVFCSLCAWKVYAGSINMTTYYPAPAGYYNAVNVNSVLRIPCYNDANQPPSSLPVYSIWVNQAGGAC